MRFDELTNFGPITLTGTSVDSNILDMGAAEIAMSPAYIVVTVTTKVTAATKLELKTSATNGSDYVTVGAVEFKANDDVGTQKTIVVPPQCLRYLKLVATGTSMGGKLEAGLTLCAQSAKGIDQYAAN